MYPVYLIVCNHPNYGRFVMPYVGCIYTGGKTVEDRFNEHMTGRGAGKYLHRAAKKYGRKFFFVRQIDAGNTPEQAQELEKFWVAYYKTRAPHGGYNLTAGGKGVIGYKFTDKDRTRMSQSQKNVSPEIQAKRNSYLKAARTPEHQRVAASKAWIGSEKQRAAFGRLSSLSRTEKQMKACTKNGSDVMRLHGDRIRSLRKPEHFITGGKVAGKHAVESGQIYEMHKLPKTKKFMDAVKKSGKKLPHIRWHVKRNIISPSCKFCQENA
jgi:hypothetical protein